MEQSGGEHFLRSSGGRWHLVLVAGVGQHGARQSGATSHPIGTTKSPSGIMGDPRYASWILQMYVEGKVSCFVVSDLFAKQISTSVSADSWKLLNQSNILDKRDLWEFTNKHFLVKKTLNRMTTLYGMENMV